MGRREPRAPRRPRPWLPMLAYALIAVGVAAALYFAFRPAQADEAKGRIEGCGDPALSVVLNGEGSNVTIGKRAHAHSASTDCYHDAVTDLIIAGVLLVAPFALIGVMVYVARRDPDLDSRRP